MAPLAVDPQALDGAGATVVSASEGLGSVVSTLTTALAGCNAMAGDDPAGAAFGRTYNRSASKLLEAMTTTRNGLCGLGDGVRMSAHNYSVAEAMSNVSGHGEPLPAPHPAAHISAGSTPSAVGSGISAPAGWGWVVKFIGMIWPNGDSAKLRAAAAAWTNAGTNFEAREITSVVGPMKIVGTQQMPEGPTITAAFTEANRSAAGILQQCTLIATQLTAYAAEIDTVHAAILDLLSRICDPMTGLKEVWEFLTDEDEDEIKKIANDIRTIVNQFTSEVDALRQQIATALTEAKTILTTMAPYAGKRYFEGVGGEVVGIIEDTFWTFNPLRAIVDPDGFYHSVAGAITSIEPLVGLDGEQSFKEGWKDLGKGVTHWDEWSTDPFRAGGETVVDVITLVLPGGLLSKLPKVGRAAADAARGLNEVHPPKLRPPHPEPQPRTPAPLHGKPAPAHDQLRSEPPKGGRPAPAPKPKPAPAPHGPAPHGPTESKVPSAEKPAPGAAPKPPVEPAPSRPGHEPASGEPLPGPAPSAPLPASASHPAPDAAHTAAPVPHPPGAGHPHEPPGHGGERGDHPSQPPHDSASGRPGEGNGPHEPHPPGDDPAQGVAPPGGPEFTFDNPLDHMSPELRALSEQHFNGSGRTVIGPFSPPGGGLPYTEVAQDLKASYFDIGDAWDAATPAERLAANQHLLDLAIANRDTIALSVPFDMVDADSFTAAEIRYLELHGYRQIDDTTWIPSAGKVEK